MAFERRAFGRWLCVAAVLVFTAACAGEPKVQVPPRVELHRYGTIGIIDFSDQSSADHGHQASQLFMHMVQRAQPGVPMLELGTSDEVLARVGREVLDFEAVRAIGETYRVDAVFSGDVGMSRTKTNVQIGRAFDSMSASANLNGRLDVRLMETRAGATVWSQRATATANLAHVGVAGGALPSFGATDKRDVERGLVEDLVAHLQADFVPRWVRP